MTTNSPLVCVHLGPLIVGANHLEASHKFGRAPLDLSILCPGMDPPGAEQRASILQNRLQTGVWCTLVLHVPSSTSI